MILRALSNNFLPTNNFLSQLPRIPTYNRIGLDVLQVEPIGFADGCDIGYMRKGRQRQHQDFYLGQQKEPSSHLVSWVTLQEEHVDMGWDLQFGSAAVMMPVSHPGRVSSKHLDT